MRLVLNTFGPVPEFSGEVEQRINQVNAELINAVTLRTTNVGFCFHMSTLPVHR